MKDIQKEKITKIFNPNTKRYVQPNGKIAKQLYILHFKKEITLTNDEVLLIRSSQSIIETTIPKKSSKKNIDKLKSITKSDSLLQYFKVLKLSQFSNLISTDTEGTSKIYNGVYNGDKYYIKHVVKKNHTRRRNEYGIYDIELATNEILASLIYRKIYNVPAIKLYLLINDIKSKKYGKYMVASKAIEIDTCETISQECLDILDNKVYMTIEPFFVDCIMANWDVASKGNIGIIKPLGQPKKAFRIDVGGSLLYRAMGNKREYKSEPSEHMTFLSPQNKGYKVFRHLLNSPKQVDQAMDMILNAKNNSLENMMKFFQKSLQENIVDDKDLIRALEVLKSVIPIIAQRHDFYVKNSNQVKKQILKMGNQISN